MNARNAIRFSELNLTDLIMGLEEEGLSEVSFDFVELMIQDLENVPGRSEFLDATVRQQDRSYLRSDELYQRLIEQ